MVARHGTGLMARSRVAEHGALLVRARQSKQPWAEIPTRHWPVAPKVNKRRAPLWSSSQSAPLLDPIVPFRCRPLTDAEMQIPVCTTFIFIGAEPQLISPWIWRRPQRYPSGPCTTNSCTPERQFGYTSFRRLPILKIGYSHRQKRRAHRYNTSKVESNSPKYNQHPYPRLILGKAI